MTSWATCILIRAGVSTEYTEVSSVSYVSATTASLIPDLISVLESLFGQFPVDKNKFRKLELQKSIDNSASAPVIS
ncbi:hypothetical protein Zmor_026384 [Zophobas morio]|uniref:Uncharacterized protein n=1 Tax=Zophobas morio TaxID=2755281 RepID=A0AA38M5W7_9CUCU|nr:hypothetical protein Zmor_026384 [Zophobas morio]